MGKDKFCCTKTPDLSLICCWETFSCNIFLICLDLWTVFPVLIFLLVIFLWSWIWYFQVRIFPPNILTRNYELVVLACLIFSSVKLRDRSSNILPQSVTGIGFVSHSLVKFQFLTQSRTSHLLPIHRPTQFKWCSPRGLNDVLA